MPDLEGEERCEDEVQERQVEGNGRRKEQDRQEDEGADGESPQVVLRQRPQECGIVELGRTDSAGSRVDKRGEGHEENVSEGK